MKNLLNFKSISGINFFNLVAVALCFYCLTACQKNEMEELDEEITETTMIESKDNQTLLSLPVISEDVIDLSEYTESVDKATSRSSRTLILKESVRVDAGDWHLISYLASTMSNPLENKYEVVLKPISGRPDSYIYGYDGCLLYTSPSPRDRTRSRMPSSA